LLKDGEVTVEEFLRGVTVGATASFASLPEAFQTFIDASFKAVDKDGDGLIALREFRLDAVKRTPCASIKEIDQAFEKLLNVRK